MVGPHIRFAVRVLDLPTRVIASAWEAFGNSLILFFRQILQSFSLDESDLSPDPPEGGLVGLQPSGFALQTSSLGESDNFPIDPKGIRSVRDPRGSQYNLSHSVSLSQSRESHFLGRPLGDPASLQLTQFADEKPSCCIVQHEKYEAKFLRQQTRKSTGRFRAASDTQYGR